LRGSVVGCLALHYLGRKGGEALVRRKFTGEKIERAMADAAAQRRHRVLVPCLLPPPSPFKIFILLAGVVGISATRLAIAIAIGRGVRYLALGLLAVAYGERAMTYMSENGTTVSLAAVAGLAIGCGAYLLWRKARAAGLERAATLASPGAAAQIAYHDRRGAHRRHSDPERSAVARRAASRVHGDADGLGAPYEIIVVDDGSTDESFEILARLQARIHACA
jgi:hypothetical protein